MWAVCRDLLSFRGDQLAQLWASAPSLETLCLRFYDFREGLGWGRYLGLHGFETVLQQATRSVLFRLQSRTLRKLEIEIQGKCFYRGYRLGDPTHHCDGVALALGRLPQLIELRVRLPEVCCSMFEPSD